MVPLRAALGKPTCTAGPSRVSLGRLGIAPRRLRGSAHSPSSGRQPRPQEGQHLPRGHTATRLGSLTGGLWRFGPGQGPRDCPPRHTPRSRSFPARPGRLPSRQQVPAAQRRSGVARLRGSRPGGTPCPSPGRALGQVSAAGAREDRGGRRRAPSGGRRGQGAGARVPPTTPPGGGAGSLGFPPRARVSGPRARAPPFLRGGSTFGWN